MNQPRIAIIQFPGSNTERETILAIARVGMVPVEFLWNEPADKLRSCDGSVIVGGFAYEDRSRAGVIAALDPVMQILRTENEAGKPLLGICNGAQILVEAGIVPGLPEYRLGMALVDNKRMVNGHVIGTGYYNDWASLKLSIPPERTAFTRALPPGGQIRIPFAHAEGRFLIPEALLDELIANDRAIFRYCDNNGDVIPDFPVNPNGSVYNLAAVANPAGTAMAIMPHPERTTGGDAIFASMKLYLEAKQVPAPGKLTFDRPHYTIGPVTHTDDTIEWFVDLIITDNEARSVQNALRKAGFPVTITRNVLWEISCSQNDDNKLLLKNIEESGELFNSNKERLLDKNDLNPGVRFLVRQKDDVLALKKLENLQGRFGLNEVKKLGRGIVWTITVTEGDRDSIIRQVLDSHILFNPLSHECTRYE